MPKLILPRFGWRTWCVLALFAAAAVVATNFWLAASESLTLDGKSVHKGQGTKKGLHKNLRGNYIKYWEPKNRDIYTLEKTCYERLKDYPHFPRLVNYDDAKLELEIENSGTPLRSVPHQKIPAWQEQIKEIICNLEKEKIAYGDWNSGNLLVNKKGFISLIDFEKSKINGNKKTKKSPDVPLKGQTLSDYIRAMNLRIWGKTS